MGGTTAIIHIMRPDIPLHRGVSPLFSLFILFSFSVCIVPCVPLTQSPAPAAWVVSLPQFLMSDCPLADPLPFIFECTCITPLLHL